MPLFFLFCLYLSRTSVIHCVRTIRTNTWWDEHLTEDNASFVKKIITDEYQQLTADKLNPLKDEPWPRHEWVEGGSGHIAQTFKDLFIDPDIFSTSTFKDYFMYSHCIYIYNFLFIFSQVEFDKMFVFIILYL